MGRYCSPLRSQLVNFVCLNLQGEQGKQGREGDATSRPVATNGESDKSEEDGQAEEQDAVCAQDVPGSFCPCAFTSAETPTRARVVAAPMKFGCIRGGIARHCAHNRQILSVWICRERKGARATRILAPWLRTARATRPRTGRPRSRMRYVHKLFLSLCPCARLCKYSDADTGMPGSCGDEDRCIAQSYRRGLLIAPTGPCRQSQRARATPSLAPRPEQRTARRAMRQRPSTATAPYAPLVLPSFLYNLRTCGRTDGAPDHFHLLSVLRENRALSSRV